MPKPRSPEEWTYIKVAVKWDVHKKLLGLFSFYNGGMKHPGIGGAYGAKSLCSIIDELIVESHSRNIRFVKPACLCFECAVQDSLPSASGKQLLSAGGFEKFEKL